jgi:hypothetical protein
MKLFWKYLFVFVCTSIWSYLQAKTRVSEVSVQSHNDPKKKLKMSKTSIIHVTNINIDKIYKYK